MSIRQRINIFIPILAGLILFALPMASVNGEVPLPEVPKAKKKAGKDVCVEPVEDMRKNHMDYLLHQRDDTLRKGIRTKQHSLVECIDCHVTPDSSGKYTRFGESEHFCSSCHNYVAVSIDCFQCHADHPVKKGSDVLSTSREKP